MYIRVLMMCGATMYSMSWVKRQGWGSFRCLLLLIVFLCILCYMLLLAPCKCLT